MAIHLVKQTKQTSGHLEEQAPGTLLNPRDFEYLHAGPAADCTETALQNGTHCYPGMIIWQLLMFPLSANTLPVFMSFSVPQTKIITINLKALCRV